MTPAVADCQHSAYDRGEGKVGGPRALHARHAITGQLSLNPVGRATLTGNSPPSFGSNGSCMPCIAQGV